MIESDLRGVTLNRMYLKALRKDNRNLNDQEPTLGRSDSGDSLLGRRNSK